MYPVYLFHYVFNTHRFQDLNPLTVGEQACPPSYCVGPIARNYVLIHYVLKGRGILYTRGSQYTVEAGQAFLICPNETVTYIADAQNPWQYQWIDFDGDLSKDFSTLPPVFPLHESIFQRAFSRANSNLTSDYHFVSVLFQLYDALFYTEPYINQHVSKIENYIRLHFMHGIRIGELAAQMNLDRSYLSRLFKKKTGRSIQEYLMQVRLEEAVNYLKNGYSVSETAAFCGYENVKNFSRMFKKFHGISPTSLKQNKES